jgi:DNA-directed RNA polymerase specialized sigma24 family protein
MSIIVKKKKYLSNKELYMELVYSKAGGKLTPEAARMLMLLGKNVIKKMYYRNSDDKQDCLQEAMLSCFRFWYNFDELKGDNAFSYFTEVIKRGLAKGWNAHYKTKGADVEIISLSAYDSDGNSYDRF